MACMLYARITLEIRTTLPHPTPHTPAPPSFAPPAGAGLVNSWAAAVIGAVGGVFYVLTSEVMLRFKLDDVVNAVAIHLSPGIWGVVAVGFFARPSNIKLAYSVPECALRFLYQILQQTLFAGQATSRPRTACSRCLAISRSGAVTCWQ